mmetsp:Transcript_48400/g.77114  ORF Transcript_48400/g.77114 Transcript_48400/m.77114 type:complete len:93 (-) Transcript_48400:5-283(-)
MQCLQKKESKRQLVKWITCWKKAPKCKFLEMITIIKTMETCMCVVAFVGMRSKKMGVLRYEGCCVLVRMLRTLLLEYSCQTKCMHSPRLDFL